MNNNILEKQHKKMISMVRLNGVCVGAFSKIGRPNCNSVFLKHSPNYFIRSSKSLRNNCSSITANHIEDSDHKFDDSGNSRVGHQHGVSMIPKHVAISLDGNRRWLKPRGLELDYKPFFQAKVRFVDYCLKWGVGTGTSYVYGLGNVEKRAKEATDIILEQFETYLEEELENFKRKGVRVSVVGEKFMLSGSCQATINKVEEATKHNTKLDFILPIYYTSQRDIVHATRKICKKVVEGSIAVEDVNEGLIEQHLSLCGSRPLPDLFLRTGGHIRIGMLLGWQVAHVELYFTDNYAPDFGEDVFLDALRSYQLRERKFGK